MTIRRAEFKAVADIVKKYRYFDVVTKDNFRDFASELATYFKQNNPSFDRERFMRACGWYDEV